MRRCNIFLHRKACYAGTFLSYSEHLLETLTLPLKALCHCISCRKATGSTYTTTVLVPTSAFTFLSGAESLKSYTTIHESGLDFTFKFCPKCATKIYKQSNSPSFADVFIVFAGNFDKEPGEQTMGIEDVKVDAEFWTQYRVGWLEIVEGARQALKFE